ncbi:MAG: hypothetical protein NUW21_08255, partial [Elusimicrobia bacterium]|nr:hypothetical protein [Elusimicrobiota bacterium]
MGNRILLIFALAAASLGSRTAAQPLTPTPAPPAAEAPAGTFSRADAALAEAHRAMKNLRGCMIAAAALRADWVKKTRELKAEFKTVPPAFNGLLLKKRKRADEQEAECLAAMEQPALLFTQAHDLLRSIEPRNAPGVVGRFKKVEEGRAQYNRLIAKT